MRRPIRTRSRKSRFSARPRPELPAKIKAQQDASRLDINLVLTGQDGGSLLAQNKQIIQIPDYKTTFPRETLTEAGKALYDEGGGYLIPSVGNAGGPVLIYNPSQSAKPAKERRRASWPGPRPIPASLCMRARPIAVPGRAVLQGFAFILGDSKPLDPEKGWEKSWDYLKELGKYGRILSDRHRRSRSRNSRKVSAG